MIRPQTPDKPEEQEIGTLPVLGPALDSIVAPIGSNRFLKDYWKKEVFHCPGSSRRLTEILDTLGSIEVATLLANSRRYAVLGCEPGEISTAQPSLTEALEAYRTRGATLYFCMNEDSHFNRWTSALADQLGEPPIGVTSFFAVRNRNGTRPHLDWNENFTIQIHGTKQWLVAPNQFVTYPVTNWELGAPPPLYANASRLPEKMPAVANTYLLEPGSVLYVPRGHLHRVTSIDDAESLSLNLSFPPTPWAVILCTLLSTRLLELPEFRAGLTGAFGQGWGREHFLKQVPEILKVFSQNAEAIGDDLRRIVEDPKKLEQYLAKRRYPVL